MNDMIAIVLAGGSGERFGMMKQFVPINGTPVCEYTLKRFSRFLTLFVVPKKYLDIAKNIVDSAGLKNVFLVCGGDSRQESVFNALQYIEAHNLSCKKVLITDANRPCLTQETIDSFVKSLKHSTAAIAVCKSINTSCSRGVDKQVDHIYDRTRMYEMLMPQGFDYRLIYDAHNSTKIVNATDDAQLLTDVGIDMIEISYWEGLKLTNSEDYKIFEVLLR